MLILASSSPRRQELLRLITPDFTVLAADFDERALSAPTPRALVEKLAAGKAQVIAALHPGDAVIGCDTVVDFDGTVLGKPAGPAEAKTMLRALSARWHYVHTGVCVLQNGTAHSFVETTKVFFAALSDDEIDAYLATGEAYDKAGGYGIQGAAAKFVTHIDGCFFNVMGLPIARLYAQLRALGLAGQG